MVAGAALGIGLVLVASIWLWPSDATARPAPLLMRTIRERLVQAGLNRVSPTTVLIVSGILSIVTAAVLFAAIQIAAVAIAAGVLAAAAPWAGIVWRARAQRRAARVIWPDVVDHLVSAVRSGLALPDSVVSLAKGGPEATREAFAEFDRDYRAAGNFADCLDRLKDRLADPVADRIIETLRMAREVGGNQLTTTLRNLAIWLRQDAALRAEAEARQSWIVNAARLGIAAPWIILLLLCTRPEGAHAYNTTAGTVVIVAGVIVSFAAYRAMIALGRLPEEKRWFR